MPVEVRVGAAPLPRPALHSREGLSLLGIHGTADPLVPYFGQTRKRTADGLRPFGNGWVASDRCRGRPAVSAFARRATAFSWSECAGSVRVGPRSWRRTR